MRTRHRQPTSQSARDSFKAETDAWSYAEIIRFGPVTEQNRLERMLFWPDRKGIGLKQVQAALAAKDATAADPAQLPAKSVAMQGLGALEFVLFGTGAEALAARVIPIAARMARRSPPISRPWPASVDAAWAKDGGFAGQWAQPGPGNPLYQSGTEAVTELLEVFVNGLELVRDVRLGGFLGRQAGGRQAEAGDLLALGRHRALACRQSGRHEGAVRGVAASAISCRPIRAGSPNSIKIEFGNAIDAANALDGPIDDTLADPKKRDKLAYFSAGDLEPCPSCSARGWPAEFGLTAGFSSLDGD